MTCNKEKEVIMCVIEAYRDMPYLWQKEHEHYLNKDMRAEGFRELLEIYRRFHEDATMKILKKKIENMRTSFAKELKKIQASKQSGAEADDLYVPRLWYFDALSFLGSRTESYRSVNDLYGDYGNLSSDNETTSVANSSSGQQKRKKKETLLQKEEDILLALEKSMTKNDEEWEVYGRSIGFQMKNLNKRQLMISQKIISDVMFYANLDQLTESSCVVLRPSNESVLGNSGFYHNQNQFYTPSPPSNYLSPSDPSLNTNSAALPILIVKSYEKSDNKHIDNKPEN